MALSLRMISYSLQNSNIVIVKSLPKVIDFLSEIYSIGINNIVHNLLLAIGLGFPKYYLIYV